MTLEELKAMDGEIITPKVAAQLLCVDPHYIRVAARTNPELLGFPVMVCRSRVKILRRPFIQFLEGGRKT